VPKTDLVRGAGQIALGARWAASSGRPIGAPLPEGGVKRKGGKKSKKLRRNEGNASPPPLNERWGGETLSRGKPKKTALGGSQNFPTGQKLRREEIGTRGLVVAPSLLQRGCRGKEKPLTKCGGRGERNGRRGLPCGTVDGDEDKKGLKEVLYS